MKALMVVALVAIAGSVVIVGSLTDWPAMRYRQDDFIAYWTASRALLDGLDPYDPAVQRALHDAAGSSGPEIVPGTGFGYPLPTAVMTLPFALLPVRVAAPVWFVTQLVSAAAALIALGGRLFAARPRRDLVLLLALGALMQPTFILSGDGNVTHYLVGIVGGSLALLLAGQPLASGLLLGLGVVKPHLLLLYVPALLLFAPRGDRLRLAVGGGLSSGALLAISFALRPGWLGEWAMQTIHLPSDAYGAATLWAILPEPHGLAIALAIAACGGLLVWQRRARPSLEVSAAAALALSLFLGPYAYTGDQAVLLVGVAAFIALIAGLPGRMRALLLLALVGTSSAWFLPWAAGLVPAGPELILPAPALALLLVATQLGVSRRAGTRV